MPLSTTRNTSTMVNDDDVDLSQLIAKDILPQTANWKGTEKFLLSVVQVLLKYIREENVRENKILEFHHPAEMLQLIDLDIPERPQNLESLVKSCEEVLRLGVRTGHPRFFNQISCGLDLVSMAGEWLTATANTNMFTYEIAPVFILMEKAVMKRMWEAIGWDVDQADGIFAPGGAIANLYAVSTARHALYPRSKYVGLKDVPTLCIFTSEDVRTLRLRGHAHPFGPYNMQHLNFGLLFQCNQMSADYLFMQDKPYDVSYDTGDKAIQCGRHNDVFKLWLMWKSKGMEGYRQQVNKLMDLTAYFTQRIRETEGYELVVDPPEFLNVCFWYIPSNLRGLDPAEKKARLEKIAPKIKARMMERGTTMVGYQPDKQRPNFFRMIISSQAITRDDLDFLIQEIVDIGESL
ncbi:hypothetical protein GCK32_006366 [Trichostrongylus colubriformis]|uniref:Glutamate decarboxylase n=1 Tax=Trichostrongylus colubriformis TaxID=6319 RepID=A0AAN8EUJ5_TRICO